MNKFYKSKKPDMETIIIILIIGMVAGGFSGIIGIGGGIIVVPCLVYFLGMSQQIAQGTSLAMMLPPIGVMAVYNYYKAGVVDFKVAAILCISFIAGSYFGSLFAVKLSPEFLKKLFGTIIIIVGIKLIFFK
jgi:uncharacterized membrane protein YfcA